MIRLLFCFLCLVLGLSNGFAQTKPEIQIGLSSETIEISSHFVGTDLVIFGSIEKADQSALLAGEYDIVVVLAGPRQEVMVRRKENKLGIWVNGKSMLFNDVPASYAVATTRLVSEIAGPEEIRILQIGLDNISVVPEVEDKTAPEVAVFRQSLTRLKQSKLLYNERIGGVVFLSPTLFKATLTVPANVPIGKHIARAFLFRNGEFVNSQFAPLQVKKIGFEQFTYDFAHNHGFLFGIVAVLIAVATGWLASVVFRKD